MQKTVKFVTYIEIINVYLHSFFTNVFQTSKVMGKNELIKLIEDSVEVKEFKKFKAGDTITVTYKIKEGNKERLQKYQGVVIQRVGSGPTETFTVRKISNGIGVERIFPISSPFIDDIAVNKVGVVRRARIFYFRELRGKKARIKEARR